jgi:hypothetical protein
VPYAIVVSVIVVSASKVVVVELAAVVDPLKSEEVNCPSQDCVTERPSTYAAAGDVPISSHADKVRTYVASKEPVP